MKTLLCQCGKFIYLDDHDFEQLTTHNFHCNETVVSTKIGTVPIGRLLLRPATGLQVDHINHDIHDNRRINLRIATPSQNGQNRRKRSDNTSGYKGVSWKKANKAWQAYIKYKQKTIYLGLHNTPELAALAYNKKARELFGEFALLNVVAG